MEGEQAQWKLRRPRRVVLAAFCSLVLVSASPAESPSVQQGAGQQDSAAKPISASELARLSEISTRLAELNTRLRTELEDSRRSSLELASSLENSTRGLEALRLELEASQRSSSELAARAESSEKDLSALREALTRADSSLRNLESSFGEYRRTAETRILALQAERVLWWGLAGAGCIAAVLALVIR